MTFDLTPDQRTMTEHLAWLINHPSAWEGALSLRVSNTGSEVLFDDLSEWTHHYHSSTGYCHKENGGLPVRVWSCADVKDCDDLCPCGEPIPHAGDPTCSSEHNNSAEYDEAIEAN